MTAKRHVDYVNWYAPNLTPVIPHDATLAPSSKIDPGNRGKVPGQRNSDGLWYGGWKTMGDATLARAKIWDGWGAYIGFRTGNAHVFAIDIDLTVHEDSERVLLIAIEIFGKRLAVRRVDHPDHAKLLICLRLEEKTPDSFNVELLQSDGKRGGIQYLGPGRYFNVHGIHPRRLKPYVWENDPADIPLTLVSLIEFDVFWKVLGQEFQTVRAARVHSVHETGRPIEHCTSEEMTVLLELIPNDETFAAYDDFIRMGSAIHGASNGAGWGRVQWLAWCAQVDQEQEDKPEIFWDTMLKARIGADCLRKWANERAPYEMARRAFADPPIEDVEPELVAESDADADLAKSFLEDWCLIGGEGFCRLPPSRTLRPMKAAAFGLVHAAQEKAIKRALGGGGGKKGLSLAKLFARHSENLVDGVVHEPGKLLFIDEDDRRFLNLWTAPAQPWRDKPIDLTVIEFYRELALFVFGDPEIVHLWFLWHAWMLQNPDKAPGWHWIIQTGSGLGKDLLLQPMRRAHGDDFYQATPQLLAEKFNPYAEKHLVGVSEMKERDNDDVYTKLQLITSGLDHVMVRTIGRSPYQARNVVGLVIYSNERHPLKIPATDRRFRVVANFEAQRRGAEYYASARALFDRRWPMIAEHLRRLPISAADALVMAANAPENEAKAEMAEQAAERALLDIIGEIESDNPPPNYLPVATTTDLLQWLKAEELRPNEMPKRLEFPSQIYRLGARPLNPSRKNPKRAEPIFGKRLWRIARYWTDPQGVRWDIGAVTPTRLAKLYSDRSMPPTGKDSFKVVDDEEGEV
jgi:hypothetical protein